MFAPLDRADLKPVIACTFYCTTGIISGLIVPYNELANALPPPIPSMGFNPPTIEPLRSSEWSSAQLDIACTSLDAVLTQSATRPRTARRKRPCVHENDTEPQASPSQPAEHHHLRCLNDGTAMAVAAPPPPPLQPVAGSAMDSMDPLMQCSWRRCGEHVSRNTAWGHFQAAHCGVYKRGDMRNHHMEQHCHVCPHCLQDFGSSAARNEHHGRCRSVLPEGSNPGQTRYRGVPNLPHLGPRNVGSMPRIKRFPAPSQYGAVLGSVSAISSHLFSIITSCSRIVLHSIHAWSILSPSCTRFLCVPLSNPLAIFTLKISVLLRFCISVPFIVYPPGLSQIICTSLALLHALRSHIRFSNSTLPPDTMVKFLARVLRLLVARCMVSNERAVNTFHILQCDYLLARRLAEIPTNIADKSRADALKPNRESVILVDVRTSE